MEIGMLAISKAGHDCGCTYMIIAFDEEYVYLVDGKMKFIAKPKKKRWKHIQIIKKVPDLELAKRMKDGQNVTDVEVKHAIRQYTKDKI